MKLSINWDRVRQEALTDIRQSFPVEKLIELNQRGDYTPVSGDALAKVHDR